jgi:hypothetical protein
MGVTPSPLFHIPCTTNLLLASSPTYMYSGCGRGYDVTFLSSPTRFVFGLDIAVTATETALARAVALSQDPNTAADVCLSQLEFVNTSFFELPTELEKDKFNFIYDYTFLCALDPSIRGQWAKKMSDLLVTGGELVTLIFPICDKPDGPPYKMSIDLVRELMEGVGLEAVQLEPLPSELCHEGRDGSGMWEASSAIGRWRKV